MKILEQTQAVVNKLWLDAKLPKLIQFGRDGQGAHSHSFNGPTLKKALRNQNLLIDTIEAMRPVYALYERGKYDPGQKMQKVKVVERGDASKAGEGGSGAPGGKKKGPATEKVVKPRKKKVRGTDFGEVGCAGTEKAPDPEGAGEEPAPPGATEGPKLTQTNTQQTPNKAAACPLR